MNKVLVFALFTLIIYSCGSNDRGELMGVKYKKKWFSEKPFGMALIPGGSFTMGKQDQDVIGTMSTPTIILLDCLPCITAREGVNAPSRSFWKFNRPFERKLEV